MKKAAIIHNPGAGDETHDHKELIEMVEGLGFKCHYHSTKGKAKAKIKKDDELLLIAGGDGTVRKVAKLLFRNPDIACPPIYLMPKGTANNFAYTLKFKDNVNYAKKLIKAENIIELDVWHFNKVKGLNFFLEGLGFGLFPHLISDMRQIDNRYKDEPEKKLGLAIDKLHVLAHEFPSNYYEIYADDKNLSGHYIMVELMNIKSIGPNMVLAKEASPSDGFLDLILVDESEREALGKYLKNRSMGKNSSFKTELIRAKEIKIVTNTPYMHADDEIIQLKKKHKFKIALSDNKLRFLTS